MRSLAGIARESSGGAGLGDAPSNAPYVTTASDVTLTNEQVLGTTIIIRDLAANIPAASIAGRLFIESDGSQIIYRDTGLAWVEIVRGATIPINPILSNVVRDSQGRVTSYSENGTAYTITYDSTSRIATINANGSTKTVSYDGSSNVTGIA